MLILVTVEHVPLSPISAILSSRAPYPAAAAAVVAGVVAAGVSAPIPSAAPHKKLAARGSLKAPLVVLGVW